MTDFSYSRSDALKRSLRKVVWGSYVILILGFAIQSLLLFTAINDDNRFSIIAFGICAFMFIPYLIFIIANRHINSTKIACGIIMSGAIIIAFGGVLTLLFAASSGPIGGVFVCLLSPAYGFLFSVLCSAIAMVLNSDKRLKKISGFLKFG